MVRIAQTLLGITLVGCAIQPGATKPERQADTDDPFRKLDEAAKAACAWIWAHEPKAKEFEYCGLLYRDGDEIRVGLPVQGAPAQCIPPQDPPGGTTLLGRYHSHRLTPEPSLHDRKVIAARYPGLGHYLCAPSGIVRRFSASGGTVIVQ